MNVDDEDSRSGWLAPLWSSPSRLLPESVIEASAALVEKGKGLFESWVIQDTAKEDSQLLAVADVLSSGNADAKEMLESVSVALRRQDEINRETTQLARVNYVANLANMAKHRQIEACITEGKRNLQRLNSQLQTQTSTITQLKGRVSGLTDEVDSQKKASSRLEKDLKQQTELLQSAVQQSRMDIEKQQSILAKQQQIVNKLAKNKLKMDFLVDLGVFGGAAFVVNTFFVDIPLRILLSVIRHENFRKWLKQLLKLLMILKMFFYLRSLLMKYGLHGRVGNVSDYAWHAFQSLQSASRTVASLCAQRLPSWRKGKKHSQTKPGTMDIC